MNRRRRIKRRSAVYRGRKIQVNFVPVIVIICLSVCAGYLTAKYVVYPILGSEPAGLNIFQEKESNEQKSEETEAETTESAAENKSTEASAETTVASAGVIEDQVELKLLVRDTLWEPLKKELIDLTSGQVEIVSGGLQYADFSKAKK